MWRNPTSDTKTPPRPAHWDELPLALAAGDSRPSTGGSSRGGSARRLRAVSAAAGHAGVRAGMTAAEARAMCASLTILDWDDVAITRAITEMTAALLAASPQVTPVASAPGTWWVGAGGFETVGGEHSLARALLSIARVWHPEPRIAIADSCVAARAGTWDSGLGTRDSGLARPSRIPSLIIPPGGDAAYLASAPLGLIPMDDELRETLASLGLRTAGAFAGLEAEDVERRWGESGLLSWRLARGEDRRRPVLARPDTPRSVSAELPSPVVTMEPVLFLVRAALHHLTGDLAAGGRAAAAIAITLTLELPGSGRVPACGRMEAGGGWVPHTVTREVRPARPLARVSPLFELCRALLEGWTLTAPACGVEVAIVRTAPAPAEQGDLVSTSWRDPAAADAAFTRIRAELGPDVVVRPVARDEHRPERSGAWVDASADSALSDHSLTNHALSAIGHVTAVIDEHALALRLLETPEPVEVERSDGMLCAVWWRGERMSLVRARGPERLSGDWWKDAYRRDYWRCESESGGEFLLFLDRIEERWYLQGWYD